MLNDALRLIKEHHRVKSKELAPLLGISRTYLSTIENGKGVPTTALIEKYSEYFKVPVSKIWSLSEYLKVSGYDGKSTAELRHKLYVTFAKEVGDFSEDEIPY